MDEWKRRMNFDSGTLPRRTRLGWTSVSGVLRKRSHARSSDFQVSQPDFWIWSLADLRFSGFRSTDVEATSQE